MSNLRHAPPPLADALLERWLPSGVVAVPSVSHGFIGLPLYLSATQLLPTSPSGYINSAILSYTPTERLSCSNRLLGVRFRSTVMP